jgi:hypothetical protein
MTANVTTNPISAVRHGPFITDRRRDSHAALRLFS